MSNPDFNQTRRLLLQLATLTAPVIALGQTLTDHTQEIWTKGQQHRFYRAPGGLFWSDRHGTRGGLFLPLGLSHALLPDALSPDGRHLAYTALDRRTGSTIRVAQIRWQDNTPTAGPSVAVTHGETTDLAARFTPDGKHLVWASLQAGHWTLQQRQFSG